MPTKTGAGPLRYKLDFQERGDGDDGYGGVIPGTGDWEDQFQSAASLTPLRGSEQVLASRLAGVQPFVCRIRQNADTRAITTAWRAVDRNGTIYQIKSPPADPDGKNAWLEFIVQTGTES